MEHKLEIKNITIDEVIKMAKEEDNIELTIAEAEEIVEFLKILTATVIKHFLDE